MDVIDLLQNHLLVHSKNPEAIVFFLKMKGDYYRYLGEFQTDKKSVIETAQDSYKRAQEEAE